MRSLSPSHRVPLLSPSESAASHRGASEVLIGVTLANGGSLEVACGGVGGFHIEPAPSFAPGRAGTKEIKRWRGARPDGVKKRGEILQWVRERKRARDALGSSLLMPQTQMEVGSFLPLARRSISQPRRLVVQARRAEASLCITNRIAGWFVSFRDEKFRRFQFVHSR